jgi:hypothetical protein
MSNDVSKYKPTEKSIKQFEEICDLIQEKGLSVRKACLELKMKHKTFYDVMYHNDSFSTQYMRACMQRAFLLAEQSIEIFDDIPNTIQVGDYQQQNTIGFQKAKAKAENLKWYASKLNKALSDKADTNINIQSNDNAVLNISFDGKDSKLIDNE